MGQIYRMWPRFCGCSCLYTVYVWRFKLGILHSKEKVLYCCKLSPMHFKCRQWWYFYILGIFSSLQNHYKNGYESSFVQDLIFEFWYYESVFTVRKRNEMEQIQWISLSFFSCVYINLTVWLNVYIYILMIRFDQNKIRFERFEMTVRLFPDLRDMLFHFL